MILSINHMCLVTGIFLFKWLAIYKMMNPVFGQEQLGSLPRLLDRRIYLGSEATFHLKKLSSKSVGILTY